MLAVGKQDNKVNFYDFKMMIAGQQQKEGKVSVHQILDWLQIRGEWNEVGQDFQCAFRHFRYRKQQSTPIIKKYCVEYE